jgi:hypothetical protein
MLRVVNSLVVVLYIVMQLCATALVHAEPTTVPTSPVLQTSPLIITAYQASIDGLDLVQIYNDSDELVPLDGMNVRYSKKNDTGTIMSIPISGYMKPASHIIVAANDVLTTSQAVSFRFTPSGWTPKAVWIEALRFTSVTIPTDVKTDGLVYKRGRTTTGYSTAVSALNSALVGNTIEADLLYTVPPSPALQIVEVSARAKTCSPFEIDPTCSDFIKLKMMPGFTIADTGKYRVRTGNDPSISNSFSLENVVQYGDYLLLNQRDDADHISLTNSGGYVWLEDIFGIQRYEETLVEYADAGSETFLNQSWAFNDQNDAWQWAVPSPTGPNTFPEVTVISPVVTLSDCPAGKYRNPETNRCRTIEEAVNALAACEEGKERNPATNRCRSIITTAVATLTPCDTGQERNPLTNRCRKSVLAASSLAPCDDGEERNSDTNRCRKVLAAANGKLAAVEDVKSPMKATSPPWLLVGAAVLLVIGYAVYEWRQELLIQVRKVTAFFHK